MNRSPCNQEPQTRNCKKPKLWHLMLCAYWRQPVEQVADGEELFVGIPFRIFQRLIDLATHGFEQFLDTC
ncbi:hypothetical protein [Ktedonobacter robiniae]|uniref:Uncharacterized protein n=1 Tax=Ktedonobacter robiniae TaxID=2778365 RepID=A0ABQ3V575_9CHLR|nr:hypothetical protein [Ktedonobacter robiniae]GHO60039.1 hypothetical protein KSB_85140 [Ktedonobacter robiniae]